MLEALGAKDYGALVIAGCGGRNMVDTTACHAAYATMDSARHVRVRGVGVMYKWRRDALSCITNGYASICQVWINTSRSNGR
jgi:hypothetical protein